MQNGVIGLIISEKSFAGKWETVMGTAWKTLENLRSSFYPGIALEHKYNSIRTYKEVFKKFQ